MGTTMRGEPEMLDLIMATAEEDDRIRGVLLGGSRANPQAPRDIFQDFDITYLVTEVESFLADHAWINRFGELMVLQLPDAMGEPPPQNDGSFAYLMQFTDGNRIDLTLFPVARLAIYKAESATVLLLDKDGLFPALPAPNDGDYLPLPPTAKAFFDCCNEFWWVCPYVAKGLWRGEILYARTLLDQTLREQVLKMLTWHIGLQTGFARNPGKFGKYFPQFLEPELWEMLWRTYTTLDDDATWEALFVLCRLFRAVAAPLAAHFGFDYPYSDDQRVSAHLVHVRKLPKDAQTIY